jgi:serine/threonine protein phosphatase 1
VDRLFAISDIHGCFRPFYELITQTIKLTKSDKLMLLGDYVDRGEAIREVIDFILDLKAEGFDVTPLIGNHEVMLLDSISDPAALTLWLLNDGSTTLNSFGLTNINKLEDRYLDFFTSLAYYKIIGNLVFVHAGFNDEAADPFLDTNGMVWESRLSYRNPLLAGKTIIHGHRPKTLSYVEKLIKENSPVLPIDTGCVYGKAGGYGYLSALELNSRRLYSVENSY